MTRPSAIPPRDPGLPGSEVLFDVEALRDLLCGDDGTGDGARVRLRYVEHEPGERAVAMVEVDDRLAAVSVGATAAAGDGVQVAWYPADPGLPGLRDGWAPLLDALGVELVDQLEPQRLTWVPHRRLVVAVGDVVVKLHASGDETQWAVDCAATVRTVVRVPDVLAADTALAAHVQRRVDGRALGRDDALGHIVPACELLEQLRQLEPARLVPYTADELLAHGRRVAALVGFVAPHEQPRLDDLIGRLTGRLAERRPGDGELVAAHGDFNIGQLLVRDDGALVLVDTDTLCAAAAGYDPASYAANLIAGRPGDLDDARAALDAFRERVPGLDRAELEWFLAAMVVRRLDRGLRRYKRSWPERTERLIDAAVELTAAL